MSFLLRRNRPWAFAGWRDSFDRANESPIGKPWAVWGVTPCTASLTSNHMVLGNANTFVDFGGWSFEHTCFTPHWGFTFTTSMVRTGTVAEIFRAICNKESWTKVNSNLSNVLGVDIQYRTAAVGSRVMINQYSGAGSAGNTIAETPIAQSIFDGSWHTWLVLIDEDSYLRLYLDGTLKIAVNIPAGAYRPSDGHRSVNFMNQMGTTIGIDDFILFDQNVDPPWEAHDWDLGLADDFNRANGAVGSPWVEIGSNDRARIVSNSYAYNSTTDGSRGILYNTGVSTGRQRVSAVIGGNNNPSGQDASLLVRCNSAGSAGIAANFFNNHVYLARLTSAVSDDNPGMTDYADAALTVAAGDTVTLSAADNWAWVQLNGETILTASGIDTLVPTSQAYAGLRVERHSFTNSASWNSVSVYADA